MNGIYFFFKKSITFLVNGETSPSSVLYNVFINPFEIGTEDLYFSLSEVALNKNL